MNTKALKVITVLGTRPEIIRLSRVMARLDRVVDHFTLHTGQNYDYELNEVFYRDLGIRRPDFFLDVKTESVGETIGRIIAGAEKVFVRERPDAVVILGDTNSALAAIVARRLKIPIYHLEAGNRCFDLNVPEETNRRIVDHISDFNLVYTEAARRNLLREGIHPRKIYLTGSPMKEVLDHYRAGIRRSTALRRLKVKRGGFFLVSVHREENVDHPGNLRSVVNILNALAQRYRIPVVVSTHPRTRKRLEALRGSTPDRRVRFMKPFGFLDYVRLQQDARCVISDSGTISEESAILGFPAVTIRNAMERPEAMDAGSIVLTGLSPEIVLSSVALVLDAVSAGAQRCVPPEYAIDNTSERVARLLLGTARLIHRWDGIERSS